MIGSQGSTKEAFSIHVTFYESYLQVGRNSMKCPKAEDSASQMNFEFDLITFKVNMYFETVQLCHWCHVPAKVVVPK